MTPPSKTSLAKTPPVSLLALLALLLALYISLRFDCRLLTADAEVLTEISQTLYETSSLIGPGPTYPFGYAYPALNVFLAHLTGVPVPALQLYIQPFLISLLVPVAYIAFFSLTGEHTAAFLATLFLSLQPEFLFEAVRSSHAKVTWMMALSLIFILLTSMKSSRGTWAILKWVALFYITAFAMITSNSFFASNYIFSIALAFLGSWFLKQFSRGDIGSAGKFHRLLFITLSCIILVFLFIFYIYSPAQRQFISLPSIIDRIAALFLDVETEAINPYSYVGATWTSTGVYFSLTLFSWVLLGVSFLGWLGYTRKLLFRRQNLPASRLLLWLFYTAFAILLAFSVFLDIAGVLQSNLQVRIFPNLMVFAIPLASLVITDFNRKLQLHSALLRKTASAALFLAVIYFSGTSLLKVTNEPLLSNYVMFYAPGESRVLSWISDRQQDAIIWSGLNNRLTTLSKIVPGEASRYLIFPSPDQLDLYGGYIQYYLVSEVTARQAARMGLPLPDLRHDTFRVYDNGQAAIYKDRPQTPYQR